MVAFMTNKTEFDMFIGYPSGYRPFVTLGVLKDITSYVPQWVKDISVVHLTYSERHGNLTDHYFTFPLAGCGADYYVYRVDVWDKLGLQHPDNATWEEFYNDLKVVAAANLTDYTFTPLGLPWGCGHWTYWQKLLAAGGQWIYENGSSAVNSPEGLIALQQMKQMYVSPPDLPNLVAPYAMSAWAELREEVAAGRLSATSWSDEKWVAKFSDPASTLQSLIGKIRVITPPGGPEGHVMLNSGVGYAVIAQSPNADICAQLCQYLLSDEVQEEIIDTAPYSMPLKPEMINSAKARTRWGNEACDVALSNIREGLPTAEALCDAYYMQEVNAQVPIFRAYITGEIDAQTCLNLLESTSNQIRGFS
jgi:ABC-type glycerol-3-phosphate transport system substrate-binding protein